MANSNTDGSLIIDTELDNSGFERGSERLLSAIDSLSQKVEAVGTAISNAFSGVNPSIKATESAMQNTSSAAENYAQKVKGAVEAHSQAAQSIATYDKALEKLENQIIKAEEKLSGYYDALNGIDSIAESATGDSASIMQTKAIAVEQLNEKYAKELAALEQLETEEQNLKQARREAIEAAQEEAEAAEKRAQASEEEAGAYDRVSGASEDAARAEGEEAAASDRATQMASAFANIVTGLTQAVAGAASAVVNLGQKLAKIAFNAIASNIKNAISGLQSFANKAGEVSMKSSSLIRSLTSLKTLMITRIKRTFISSLFSDVTEGLQRLAKFNSEFNTRMNNIINSTAQLKRSIASIIGNLITIVEPLLTRLISIFAKAADYINQFTAMLTGKKTYSAAKPGNSNYATSGSDKNNSTNKANNNTDKSYKDAEKAAKKQYEAREKAAKEEYKAQEEMQKQSEKEIKEDAKAQEKAAKEQYNAEKKEAKKQYDADKKAAKDYAKSVKDAEKAAKKAAKAQKEWNNELYGFDELTRQARKDMDDFSDTADVDTDFEPFEYEDFEYTDVPEAVEELEPWEDWPEWQDWPERIQDALEDGDWFETMEVSLPESLMDALAKGNWYGIGKAIAEGMNKALGYLDDWINNTFRPWGVKWAGRIAQILNGIVDGLNWELLGKTVGDGLNALLDIANTFLKNFNFLNLGAGVGRAINSLVDNIDWPLLADTLKNGFMGLINLAYGFLSTFNGLKLGANIGQTIKAWFDGIDWALVGSTFALKWNALLHTIEGIVTTPGIWQSIGNGIAGYVRGWFSTIDINSLATILINVLNGVTAMIRSFLDGDPFAGVAVKVYTAVNRVIHEVDWATLGKTISDLFMSVLKVIREVVDNVDWKGVGQAIGNFLGSIDWAGIFTTVAGIVWEVFTGILSGLMSTDGGRMFLALVAAIKGLQLAFTLTQAGWKAAIQRWVLTGISPFETMPAMIGGIGTKVSGAITTLIGKLTTGLTNFTVKGKTLLSGAAATFATAALGVTDALLIAYDVKSLKDAAKTYNEAQNAHQRETQTALNNFQKLYQTKGPEIAAQWAKTCYNIDTTGMSLDQAQKALVKQVDHYWDDTPQNMWDGFKQGWKHYFEGGGGGGLLGLLGDSFTGAVDGVKGILGISSPSKVFDSIGQNLVSGLLNGIKNTWNGITSFFTTGFTNLKNGFTTTWSNIKSTAGSAWEGIKSTISQKWTNITTSVSTGWSNLKTGLENVKWDSIGSNMVSKIQSGVTSVWSRFSSSLMQGWTNIRTGFGKIQWNTIGHNLVVGLQTGISGAWSALTTLVSNCANNLVSRIKSAFGIASPSKVFAEIGKYLDAGLEKGIMDGQGKLLETATRTAEAVTDGMTPDSPDVQMSADSVVDGMQAVISGLSDIAVMFKAITDTLTAAGGFRMPQIAAGTVVPYRTRVSDQTPLEGDSEAVAGYLTSILSELQAMVRNAQNGGTNNRTIVLPVNISGHEIFQIVVDENNHAIQQRGSSPLRR